MNNYEKIKNMTIEEMAQFLENTTVNIETCHECYIYTFCEGKICNCYLAYKQWLESEE